jgi:hypothetical protein
MFRMQGPQIQRLREELQNVYQGNYAVDNFSMFLREHLDVELGSLVSPKTPLPLLIHEVLVQLNARDRAAQLLDRLDHAYPEAQALLQVISQLRAAAEPVQDGAQAAIRLQALEGDYLLIDGLPFIDRGRLRSILEDLFDPGNPARVGIVTGAALCGKTWSRRLIRAYCKAMQQPKVQRIFLDLETLQPGNDPVVVWTDLMTKLLYPQPPPLAPPLDTKGGQYVQRLVDVVITAWEALEAPGLDQKPWLLVVFDHLEKNAAPAVGPVVVDFAEALAIAVVEGHLEGGRVLLLGFPRGFSPTLPQLHVEELAPRENLSPLTLLEVKEYLKEVGITIGRGAPPEIEAAADLALKEVHAKSMPEERRAALLKMSATIGRHVRILARAK